MAMLWLSISAYAYDFEIDGICYDITSFTELTVTASSLSEIISEDVIIPTSVNFNDKTLTVTKIGDSFAYENETIKNVSVGDEVIEIGQNAFHGCENLMSITLGGKLKTLGNRAFEGCKKLQEISSESINSIGDYAFTGCESLIRVNLKYVTSLPEGAFENCVGLVDCEINLASIIGKRSFANCKSLVTINIPESVKLIEEEAFENCTSMVQFTIPNSVNTVGNDILKGNSVLQSLVIGSGIKRLPYIISGCDNLRKIQINDSEVSLELGVASKESLDSYCIYSDGPSHQGTRYYYYKSPSYFSNHPIEEVYIGRNVSTYAEKFDESYESGAYLTTIKSYLPVPPFSQTSIKTVSIGNLVTELPTMGYANYINGKSSFVGAFMDCKQLTLCQLGSSVRSVSPKAFSGCESLTNQILPNTVISIASSAFDGCTSLSSITMGCYLKSIGSNAFNGCHAISNINIYAPIPPSYSTGFSSQEYMNTVVNIPSGSLNSYQDLEPWKNFWNIKESDELISFFEVDEIKYLVISGNDVQIVGEAFSSQKNLTITSSVKYADKAFQVVSIAKNAFKNCTEIEYLEIEDGITSIGSNAFEGCKNLNNVVLPESVNVLGVGAFKHCSSLSICSWRGSIKNLPDECFYGCTSLQDVSLEGIESIGNSCFYDCDGLVKIILTPSIKSLGTDAFRACSNLKEFIIEDAYSTIDFPAGSYDGATSIQKKEINGKTIQFKIAYYNPFFNGLPIEKLYIGRNLSDTPRYTISGDGGVDYYLITSYDAPYSNLPNLKELIIGENVSTVGPVEAFINEVGLAVTPGAFKKCSSLKAVTVKTSTPPTGAEFSNIAYSNATLIVPDNTVSLFQVADGWKEFINIVDETSAGIDPITIANNCPLSISLDGIIYDGEHDISILICGIDGKCQYSGNVSPGQSITLSKGIYIVTLDSKSMKVKI